MQTNDLEYVGFWPRVGASLIDEILLAVITFPLLMAFYGESYWTSGSIIEGPMDFLLSFVFPAVTVVLFWVTKQATPGKMAVAARIVDAKTGNAPSIGQFIGRYFSYLLSVLPLGLGFFWVAFDDRKQGWHDKLAGTVVVRKKNREPKPVSFTTNTEMSKKVSNENQAETTTISLWNPNAAANWSLLFSPVFGAWLHAKNWYALGDVKKAKQSMYWVYGGIAVFLLAIMLSDKIGRAMGIGYLFGWYFSSAKQQVKYVKENLNNVYQKKGWAKPIGIAVVSLSAFIIFAGVVATYFDSDLQQEFAVSETQQSERNENIQYAVVNSPDGKLNMRSGPGIEYNVVAVMDSGLKVKITGVQVGNWVPISANGSKGEVFNGFSHIKYLTLAQ